MSKVHILIVAAVGLNILAIKKNLEHIDDIVIYESQTFDEAFKIVIDEKIDLLLLDINAPENDGFDFANRLKDNPFTTTVPVIFISDYTKKEYRLKGYKTGAVDYITKPIDEDIFTLKIQKYIKIIILKKLREDKNKYIQSILEASSECQIIVNKSLNILDYNKKALGLFASISKGITLENLFAINRDFSDSFMNYMDIVCLDCNATEIFRIQNKDYKVSYKVLNENQCMLTFFDITKEIKESKRKDVIYNAQR